MLLLHACGPQPDRPVALDTARKAGLLTAWLHGHQLALKRKVGAIDPLASFVQERVVREKKSAVTLEEVHRAAQDYFIRQGLTPPPFLRFRSRIAPLVRTHLSAATSHSVRGPDGKQQVGWNNVALRSGPIEPNRWLTG